MMATTPPAAQLWLEVHHAGASHTLALGNDAVFIGSSAGECAFCVPHLPARALRFQLQRDHVACLDMVRERSYPVAPGQRLDVGPLTIKVCGSTGAAPLHGKERGRCAGLVVLLPLVLSFTIGLVGLCYDRTKPGAIDDTVVAIVPRPVEAPPEPPRTPTGMQDSVNAQPAAPVAPRKTTPPEQKELVRKVSTAKAAPPQLRIERPAEKKTTPSLARPVPPPPTPPRKIEPARQIQVETAPSPVTNEKSTPGLAGTTWLNNYGCLNMLQPDGTLIHTCNRNGRVAKVLTGTWRQSGTTMTMVLEGNVSLMTVQGNQMFGATSDGQAWSAQRIR